MGLPFSPAAPHIPGMTTILSILLGCALVAVVLVLLTGVVVFARGGEVNRRWSNRLMNFRVAAQFLAVMLLLALMAIHRF